MGEAKNTVITQHNSCVRSIVVAVRSAVFRASLLSPASPAFAPRSRPRSGLARGARASRAPEPHTCRAPRAAHARRAARNHSSTIRPPIHPRACAPTINPSVHPPSIKPWQDAGCRLPVRARSVGSVRKVSFDETVSREMRLIGKARSPVGPRELCARCCRRKRCAKACTTAGCPMRGIPSTHSFEERPVDSAKTAIVSELQLPKRLGLTRPFVDTTL